MGNLHLISRAGEDTVLGAFNRRSSKIEPTERFHELYEMAGDLKPKIIGIASSANVFAGSELDRHQVQQFIGLLTRVARVAGGGLVLIAHPSLTGISTGTGLSGSTQWHNAVRARMYLHGIKATDGQQPDSDLRQLEFRKNQYGPATEGITLQWDNDKRLFLPVKGASFDAATKRAQAKKVFLDLLRRFISENRTVSDRRAANYAPKIFAEEREAKDAWCSKEELAEAMRDLLRDKHIEVAVTGRASHPRHELRISSPGTTVEPEQIPF
jgi:RecA-family ATPase